MLGKDLLISTLASTSNSTGDCHCCTAITLGSPITIQSTGSLQNTAWDTGTGCSEYSVVPCTYTTPSQGVIVVNGHRFTYRETSSTSNSTYHGCCQCAIAVPNSSGTYIKLFNYTFNIYGGTATQTSEIPMTAFSLFCGAGQKLQLTGGAIYFYPIN